MLIRISVETTKSAVPSSFNELLIFHFMCCCWWFFCLFVNAVFCGRLSFTVLVQSLGSWLMLVASGQLGGFFSPLPVYSGTQSHSLQTSQTERQLRLKCAMGTTWEHKQIISEVLILENPSSQATDILETAKLFFRNLCVYIYVRLGR